MMGDDGTEKIKVRIERIGHQLSLIERPAASIERLRLHGAEWTDRILFYEDVILSDFDDFMASYGQEGWGYYRRKAVRRLKELSWLYKQIRDGKTPKEVIGRVATSATAALANLEQAKLKAKLSPENAELMSKAFRA